MNLHVLKASGRLIPFEAQLSSAFDTTLERIGDKLPLPAIDVVIADNQNSVIPETGVGGFAVNANLLYVNIDPNSEHFRTHVDTEVISTLSHELHHCARMHTIGYGKTLLEALISEGLADHFDSEINGSAPNIWSVSLKPSQFDDLYKRAYSEFDNADYKHADWFFGSEEKSLPRWTGYSLGFEIVGRYMEKSVKTAAELVATPAEAFLL